MSRTRSLLPLSLAAIAAATAIAACGASSSSSSAASSSRGHLSYAQAEQAAVNFAGCMRSHGMPSFPDPTSPGEFKVSMAPDSPLARSPGFQSAAAACQHFLGGGQAHQSTPAPEQVAAALAFARCMRGHGFPSFPDPNSVGDLSHEMLASAEINLHQPAVVGAADACVGVTHGLITKVDVARFIAGQ